MVLNAIIFFSTGDTRSCDDEADMESCGVFSLLASISLPVRRRRDRVVPVSELEAGVWSFLLSFCLGGVMDSRRDRRSELILVPRYSSFVVGVNITFFDAVVGVCSFVVAFVAVDDGEVVVPVVGLQTRKPFADFFCLDSGLVVFEVLVAFSLS